MVCCLLWILSGAGCLGFDGDEANGVMRTDRLCLMN